MTAIATVYDWSTTPAENISVNGVNIAEGCPAPNLNDAVRQVMAAVRATFNADVRFSDNTTLEGSGRIRVAPSGAGYALTTSGSGDHIAIQYVRGTSEIGRVFVSSTGITQSAAQNLIFDIGGVEAYRVNPSGHVHMGNANVPGSGKLRVSETAVGGYGITTNGSSLYTALQLLHVGTQIGAIKIGSADVTWDGSIDSIFSTSGIEAFRINATQTIHMGAPSVPGSGRVRVSETGVGGYCINTNGSATYTAVQFLNVGAQVGTITCDGSQTYYNITSDARLKDEIEDASGVSDLIDALQVRAFTWKATGVRQRAGFIAQELREVIPEAVSVSDDPDAMMAVDYSKMVPFLVAEVQLLRMRVAVLEGK